MGIIILSKTFIFKYLTQYTKCDWKKFQKIRWTLIQIHVHVTYSYIYFIFIFGIK